LDLKDPLTDHCVTFNVFRSFLENIMDHTIRPTSTAVDKCLPAQHRADVAPIPGVRNLNAGKAVTLRAKQLSVLRISNGRVWATLGNAGSYSRALARDHFLSQGQSLTLLPGQELVMESFASSASGNIAVTQFSWEIPGVTVSAPRETRPAPLVIGRGVMEPLRDLRQALRLVAGASGRLIQGLAQGAASIALMLFNTFAMNFAAARPSTCCPEGSFDIQKAPSKAQKTGCRPGS
jgi:hypothetical protein